MQVYIIYESYGGLPYGGLCPVAETKAFKCRETAEAVLLALATSMSVAEREEIVWDAAITLEGCQDPDIPISDVDWHTFNTLPERDHHLLIFGHELELDEDDWFRLCA
jgi:hypothetical protein